MYDKLFGNAVNALNYRARRQEVIAQNLANADTPRYKSQDLVHSFKNALALNLNHSQHIPLPNQRDVGVMPYTQNNQGNIDGNTVNVDQEMVRFTENALHYQILLQSIQQQVQQVKLALR